jgi:PhnB protein
MQVQPYLFFDGRCEEAADFYRRTIGAEQIMLMRWKDCPEPQQPGMVPPGSEDKVMHMALRIGDTTVLASDGRCQGQQSFQGFALSVTVPNEAEADRKFAALADGGQVQMPLALLFSALWHGRRPLRRVVDGLRGGLTGAPRPARRAASWWI